MHKRLLALLMILALCLSTGAVAEEKKSGGLIKFDAALPFLGISDKYKLPIDLSGGYEPMSTGYGWTDMSYEDPTIKVKITTTREDDCDIWIADIQIADASQLRTAAADSFDSEMAISGTTIARRVNAVVAMDGDYYCYTGWGYIIRQGEVYLERLYKNGSRDVLLIDEDGDMHVVVRATLDQVGETYNGKKIINSFFFGPGLVVDGKLGDDFDWPDMMSTSNAQRMCLAQVGPLHYLIICCGPPSRGNLGMTMLQFAKFVKRQGVSVAYNFDGGDSTMLIFKGEKVNDVTNPNTRDLADIVYFASAWPGAEAE